MRAVFIPFVLAVFPAILSCTHTAEESVLPDNAPVARTFYAGIGAENPDTKTSFARDGETYRHQWTEDDSISVFAAGSTANDCYTVKTCSGSSAEFTGIGAASSDGLNYAVYPYSSANACDGAGRLYVTFPDLQYYTVGSFGEEANVMTAVSDREVLSFRNASAYLRLAVSGNGQKVSRITVSANSGEKIAGPAVISFAGTDIPAAAMADAAVSGISLVCPEPVGIGADPVDFILALAPCTLAGGLSVTIEDASGTSMTRSVESSLVFERNMVTPAPFRYVSDTKTDSFDENAIVASFGVISDIHIGYTSKNSESKFLSALRQLKDRSAQKDPDGIDGVLIAGDISQGAASNPGQVTSFKSIYEQVFIPQQVPLVYTVGNHDVRGHWNSYMVSDAAALRSGLGDSYFNVDIDTEARNSLECRHCVVKGVHVLCITPVSGTAPSAGYDPQAIAWLDRELKAVTEAEPDKYVIVLTHPMIYNTVYGSDLALGSLSWYTSELTSTLRKYPQAVTFSGHLHFPLNDPRTVMQNEFTSFGTGSVSYMAIENGGYEFMSSATVTNDNVSFSQGLLLQLDRSGNMRVTRMDFFRNAAIGRPLELSYPASDGSHLKKYTRLGRQAANQAPVISGIEIKQGLGSASVPVFASVSAGDDEMIHHFEVTLSKDGSALWTKKYLSDFYSHPDPADMAAQRDFSLGSLAVGDQYEFTVKAYDSWGLCTVQSKSFAVSSTLSSELALYSDLDFADGSITDRCGSVTVENRGASIARTSVSFKGKSGDADALSASSGKYALCTFKDIVSADAMAAFTSAGFCVETFYVDKSPGSAVHGIVCGTQMGGWGLAVRASGVPYFIVGDAAYNTYKWCDAKSASSRTDLTHLVGVYDPGKKKIFLYVNGELNASQNITTPFYPGTGDTFNRFCLGDDIKPGGVAGDFPATNMVITDVKIYTGVMDADIVSQKYNEALASLTFL